MKTRQDFAPDMTPPRSIEEIVKESLSSQTTKTGEPYPVSDTSLDDLLKAIYAKIERESLATYHSNAPWALRQWAIGHILQDEIIDEATAEIANGLIEPVIKWQSEQPFDPLTYLRERLDFERKADRTKECYLLTAARFISKIGRKRHYTDEDVEQYLTYANKRYKNLDSYYQECRRLLQFLRRLPGADRQRQLPIKMPKMPTEFYQPTFTEQDIEKLAWSSVLDNLPPNMVVRLLVASIYGARRSEIAELRSEDIHLNTADDNTKPSTIFIRTKKGGQRKPQPIPQSLVPLFAVPITVMHGHTIQRQLKRICKKAEVYLPRGGGYHCFRRRAATTISEVEHSDIDVSNFMRWAKPRTMLARYKQTAPEVTDIAILQKHPFVKLWEEVMPYLLRLNTNYQSPLYDNT